jgi:hypothetical protein
MSGDFSALEGALAKDTSLGPGYGVANAGVVYGGGGGALIKRFWIGGKGFGMSVGTAGTDRGTTNLTGGGGGFEVGYAVHSSAEWICVPFFGMGGFGYTLKVNSSGNPVQVYAGEVIPANGVRTYTAGFLTSEVGIRASRMILFGSSESHGGGLMVGAEIGYMTSLQRTAWEATATNASAPESAGIRGAYIRLILGGGGFFFEKPEPHE